MEIHPIRNDEDHAAALREIERLWGAAAGTEEGDKLDILATLVEKYEDNRWPNIDASDPIDLLNYAIEELGHSQAELAELLGSRSRASELLNRRRPLTVEMIHKISEAWKIPADLLVRPCKIEPVARAALSPIPPLATLVAVAEQRRRGCPAVMPACLLWREVARRGR